MSLNHFLTRVYLSCSSAAPLPLPPLSESAKVFLSTLDTSSEEELSLQLQDRMQFSKGAVANVVCIFDRLHSTIQDLCLRVQAAGKNNLSVHLVLDGSGPSLYEIHSPVPWVTKN